MDMNDIAFMLVGAVLGLAISYMILFAVIFWKIIGR